MFHWLKPAVTFSRRHRKELAARPLWAWAARIAAELRTGEPLRQ